MRTLACLSLCAVALLAQAGETPPAPAPSAPPAHDEFGFPITFNDEIITKSDVLRALGPGEYPAITIRNTRNKLLREKILERVAADLGIEVEEREVEEMVRRNIELERGEAKYYEALSQRGSSLEQERLNLRRQLLQQKIRWMFLSGVSMDRRRVLPWRVQPTPREIQIAYRSDPSRRESGVRVRRQEFTITLSKKERAKVVARLAAKGTELTLPNLTKAVEGELQPRVEKAVAQLRSGTPFPLVAQEHGADVEEQAAEWVEVAKGETNNAAERFLKTATPGAFSEPLPQVGGGYRIVYLVERVNPSDQTLEDPKVVEEYRAQIADLRSQKWRALFDLRALDGSTVRPERVRDELRAELVAQLKDAESRLRGLGLH